MRIPKTQNSVPRATFFEYIMKTFKHSLYIHDILYLLHLSKAAEAFSSASFVSVTVPQSQAAWDTLNCIQPATDSFEQISQSLLRSDLTVYTVDICILMYTVYTWSGS